MNRNLFVNLSQNLIKPIRFKSSVSLVKHEFSRRDASEIILKYKKQSNYSFSDLAKKLNVNKVWLTSAILGQHPINEQISKQLIQTLNINISNDGINDLLRVLVMIPENRGSLQHSNTDPIVRRLNELVDIYGDTFKTLIREEFGDGIMSAIDCTLHFDKQVNNDKEPRIVITINGKYLQYKNDN